MGEGTEEPAGRVPERIEQQRQAALTNLAVAQQALQCGMVATARTHLLLLESHLRAMLPGGAP